MKIPIDLTEDDFEALKTLARNEYRDVRGQAAILIREELKKRQIVRTAEPNENHQSVHSEKQKSLQVT